MVKKIGLLICSGFFAAVVLGFLASLVGTPTPAVVQASERVTFWNRPLTPLEIARLNQPRAKSSLSEIESALGLDKKKPATSKERDKSIGHDQVLLPGESEHFKSIARQAAGQFELDPRLIRAVIAVESRFNPYAVSQKGASGLMQLIPSTAAEMGVDDVFSASQNIHGGARYLRILSDEFGSLDSVLCAYNAGPQRVRDRSVPAETKLYVARVMDVYRELINS